jgi:hypothetical protein
MKPETRFRINQVDPFLKKLKGIWAESIQQVSISGTPDKLMCIRGKFVALELKSDDGELSPLQKDKRFLIERAGGVYIAASPTGKAPETVSWEEAKVVLCGLAGEWEDEL